MSLRTFEKAVQLLNDRVNLERLQSFAPQEMEGRLAVLQQILDSLDNPEIAYRTVHITGTKGKGSTCVMLESILRQDSLRIGRFTSPHINSFTERLMIDGVPCPPDDFAELFFSVYTQIKPETFQSLTYFELLTLLAFVNFAQKKVDVALFEVGLGGRLDATNICKPDVSVITSISYDHMQQLGNTLESIAAEKSGIIKPHVPVITTVQHPEPLQVIRNKAYELDAPLYVLDEHFFIEQSDEDNTFRYATFHTEPQSFSPTEPQSLDCGTGAKTSSTNRTCLIPQSKDSGSVKSSGSVKLGWGHFTLDNITLTMPGRHQIRNASAALSAYLLLQHDEQKLSGEKIRAGLRQAFLPLRGEVYRQSEEFPTLLFDGAHNRASIKTFVEMVLEMFPNRRLLLIFGASQGKDVEGMFKEIADHFDRIILTQSSNTRRVPPQELRQLFDSNRGQTKIAIVENASLALKECLLLAKTSDVICIAGSLYLAAELRRYVMGETPTKSTALD